MFLPFVIKKTQPSDISPYFELSPNKSDLVANTAIPAIVSKPIAHLSNISRLILHFNYLFDIWRLCISIAVAPKIIVMVHGKSPLAFSYYHKIISHL